MERLVFADAWQDFFRRHRMETFCHFFDDVQGFCVNENSKRNVLRFTIEDTPVRTFYLKRFYRAQIKDTIGAVWRFRRPMSQGAIEWTNARHLQSHGIQTGHPVCCGEQMVAGFERRSFLVTEKVEGVCMVDFLDRQWGDLNRTEKERVVVELARLVRRLHDVNVSLPDLYIWHVFIQPDPGGGGYALSVIDLHRMIPNARTAFDRFRSVSRLHWSMSSRYFDDGLKDRLISAYMENSRIDLDRLMRSIRRNAQTLEKRGRDVDRYYAQAKLPSAW